MPSKTRSQLVLPTNGPHRTKKTVESGRALEYTGKSAAGETQLTSDTPSDATAPRGNNDLLPPTKRPSSPLKGLDGGLLEERVVKRAKRGTGQERPGESSSTAGETHASREQVLDAISSRTTKPSSTRSLPSPKADALATALTPRAFSVPPIPEIDLAQVPPSPWHSPSKGKSKFRFTSVPPKEKAQDISKGARHDDDGDVQMGESTTSTDAIPPPSSRPSSPMTPIDSSEQDVIPETPPTPTQTKLTIPASPSTSEFQVRVKTHDGEDETQAGPSTGATAPRPKTPSTSSRLPRPSAKPSGSLIQMTLHQTFASMPARPPASGVKARMKRKNGVGSNASSVSNTPEHTPSSSKHIAPTIAKPRVPVDPVARKTFTPRAKTPASLRTKSPSPVNADVAPPPSHKKPSVAVVVVERPKPPLTATGSLQPKTPARTPSTLRHKTPVPVVEVPMLRTPGKLTSTSLPRTPSIARPRSQSIGPTRPKSVSRAITPTRARTVERTLAPTSSRSRPASPIPVPRSDSPLSSLPLSRSQSPQSETRGRTRTPRALPPIPVVATPRVQPSARTGGRPHTAGDFISDSLVAIGGDEEEDSPEASLHGTDTTPKPSDAKETTQLKPSLLSSSSAEPIENPPSPSRKGKRKASVPPSGRQPAPTAPPGGRITRSSSLKHKENKTRLAKAKEVSKPEVSSRAAPESNTSTSGKSHVARRRAQSVASFAQPTASSSAKVLSSPPVKRTAPARSVSRPPASMGSRPATSMGTYEPSISSISTLSTLSLALERLNAPTPLRPNTSLGFNRDKQRESTDSNSDGEEETKSDSAMDIDPEPQPPSPAAAAKLRHAIAGGANGMTTPQYRRAATVGPSTTSSASGFSSTGGSGRNKQLTSMLPPPLPKPRNAGEPNAQAINAPPIAQKPRINLQSGIVSGKPKGNFSFGNRTAGQKIFGAGGVSGFAGLGRGRMGQRASKQSSLPVVEGSPVKGGGADVTMEDAEDAAEPKADPPSPPRIAPSQESNPFVVGLSSSSATSQATHSVTTDATADEHTPVQGPSDTRRNESRRASMALKFLSRAASEDISTPPNQAPATEGKGKGRAVSSSYPSKVTEPKTAPGGLGKASGAGAHVARSRSTRATRATPAAVAAENAVVAASPANVSSTGNTPQASSDRSNATGVLKGCTIFVDVKNDEGADAGHLFLDMLQRMGAKIQARVGQSCTHIVYKNGLVSTTNRYRALNDPKPLVVGIAWVVDCVENQKRVDETKYLINLDQENVAGFKKRRISMIPKLMESPERPTPNGPNHATEVHSSPASEDTTANGSFDHLPPLERARRRQSALLNT